MHGFDPSYCSSWNTNKATGSPKSTRSPTPDHYKLRGDLGAAAYDVFCTANLSTFPSWERAITLLLEHGLDQIEDHDQTLIDQLIDGLPARWRLHSPLARTERSTLVFLEPDSPDTVTDALARLDAAAVDAGERTGRLRVSPHVHNTAHDVDKVLAALQA